MSPNQAGTLRETAGGGTVSVGEDGARPAGGALCRPRCYHCCYHCCRCRFWTKQHGKLCDGFTGCDRDHNRRQSQGGHGLMNRCVY
ncbi:unnamed protein product, partial [Sphacelaria rigidula]